jgi:hypothetical protein
MSDKLEIKRCVPLALLTDGSVHQIVIEKDKESTLLWLIEELCDGQIRVLQEPLRGVKIEAGEGGTS